MFKFQIAYFFYEDSDDVLEVILAEPFSFADKYSAIFLCNSNHISFIYSGCNTLCSLCI